MGLFRRKPKKQDIRSKFPAQSDPDELPHDRKEKDLMKLEQAKAQKQQARTSGRKTLATAKSDTVSSKVPGEFGRIPNPFRDGTKEAPKDPQIMQNPRPENLNPTPQPTSQQPAT